MRWLRWLRAVFFGNWRNKGVALFFAVIIWYVAYQSEKKEYRPLVRAVISSADPGYVVKQIIVDETYGPIEKAFLLKALKRAEWNITRAAKQVGMQRSNFSSRMKKHRLSRTP